MLGSHLPRAEWQARRRSLAALLAALVLAACSTAHYPVNAPFAHDVGEPRYERRQMLGGEAPDGIFLHAAFSGGGTRAAAMAYGVLEVLAETRFLHGGRERRLSDELSILAGVSGGAVTSAAYVVQRTRFFDDFSCGFLYRDVQGSLVSSLLSPRNLFRVTSPRVGRGDVLAELLDERLFAGQTFGQLARAKLRPMAIISATSTYDGERFEFTQERSDALFSDLSKYPVARAVAASMAATGILSPLVLHNHGPARLYGLAIPASPLYKPYEPPYLHLMDGGLFDNLGVRNTIETIDRFGGFERTMRAIDVRHVRKLVYLVVNAQSDPGFEEAGSADVPGIVRTLRAVADIPIDRYSVLSLAQLRSRLATWVAEVRANRDAGDQRFVSADVELYFIEVSLPMLADAEERRYLMRLPTSLSLPADDVDRVRRAARTLLRESSEFRRLAADLGATVPATVAEVAPRNCPPP